MVIWTYNYLPEEALKVRMTVFVDEQGFVDEVDEIDSFATHFVVYNDGQAIATCRLFLKDNKYILGRFAVIKAFRKNGIGRKLLTAAEEYVKNKGYNELRLHSQIRAAVFYEKCGYHRFGEIELQENYPHIWMKKELN